MKGNRGRRTAEKMASYKAAASKKNPRPKPATGEKPPAVRISPRRRKNVDGGQSTAQSPSSQGSRGSTLGVRNTRKNSQTRTEGNNAAGQNSEVMEEDILKEIDMLERVPETPPRVSSALRAGRSDMCPPSSAVSDGSIQVEKDVGDLDSVPGTPPMTPPGIAQDRRKRIHAPRRTSTASGSDEESEKPSKKRRIFTTPLRKSENEGRLGSCTSRPNIGPNVARGEPERSGFTGRITDRSKSNHLSPTSWEGRGRHGVYVSGSVPVERSGMKENGLGVLTASSATLSRVLDTFGKKLVSEITSMHRDQITEVRKIADNVLSAVSSEMSHMEGVISMTTKGIGGSRSTKTSSKTSLTEWERKLNALTPETDVIFNKDIFGLLLCFKTPIQAVKVFQKHDGTDAEKAVLSAQTLLFSLQPGDKKYSYSGRVGALHSEFKFTVVQNAFFNVLRDTFGMFRTSKSDEVDSSCDKSVTSRGTMSSGDKSGAVCKIKRPSWLDTKVTKDHINEARNYLEMPNQSRKKNVRRTPIPFDIARHVALRVYRLLGNYLHVRRGAVRSTFFQNLGYLLVPWSHHIQDVDQNDVEMSWASGENVSPSFNLGEVSCTEQSGFVTDHSDVTGMDAKNKSLLAQFFSDWPEMVLSVQHQVYVVNGNGVQRRHSGGERTKIRRLFNLIDVACDVCVDYCGAGSRENFLRGHKYSLRCVMIFALLFKSFCVEFMKQTNRKPSSAADCARAARDSFPDPSDLEVGTFSLKELIPGPSTQKNLLECRCLRMTRSEFSMFNYEPSDVHRERGNEGSDDVEIGLVDIEESEEIGIGVI